MSGTFWITFLLISAATVAIVFWLPSLIWHGYLRMRNKRMRRLALEFSLVFTDTAPHESIWIAFRGMWNNSNNILSINRMEGTFNGHKINMSDDYRYNKVWGIVDKQTIVEIDSNRMKQNYLLRSAFWTPASSIRKYLNTVSVK